MRLTHRQIEVFRAVMAAGHVTRAAEGLGSSQPTVSRELARLEHTLGLALFDRVRGRLRPTARAQALLEEIERSYVGLERIAAVARGLREFAQGRLTLGCLPALAHALLPEASRRFIAKRPQAGLAISSLESPLLEHWLAEQRFDLGLVEARQAPTGTRLEPLLRADEVAVLPQGHALLGRKVLKPADFAGQAFISFSPADPYRLQIDAMFAEAGVARRLAVEADSAVAVCALVRQGLGVAIVNPLTALELAGPLLNIRPLAVSIPFHVGMVTPLLRAPSPLAEPFAQCLRESARALETRLKSLVSGRRENRATAASAPRSTGRP